MRRWEPMHSWKPTQLMAVQVMAGITIACDDGNACTTEKPVKAMKLVHVRVALPCRAMTGTHVQPTPVIPVMAVRVMALVSPSPVMMTMRVQPAKPVKAIQPVAVRVALPCRATTGTHVLPTPVIPSMVVQVMARGSPSPVMTAMHAQPGKPVRVM